MIKNVNKKCYELRLKNKLTWKQISDRLNLSIGVVWYRAKIYAEKKQKKWPIELEEKCMAEKAYIYRQEGYSWWKISKLINRSMRLCKMYAQKWAERNNAPWPINSKVNA